MSTFFSAIAKGRSSASLSSNGQKNSESGSSTGSFLFRKSRSRSKSPAKSTSSTSSGSVYAYATMLRHGGRRKNLQLKACDEPDGTVEQPLCTTRSSGEFSSLLKVSISTSPLALSPTILISPSEFSNISPLAGSQALHEVETINNEEKIQKESPGALSILRMRSDTCGLSLIPPAYKYNSNPTRAFRIRKRDLLDGHNSTRGETGGNGFTHETQDLPSLMGQQRCPLSNDRSESLPTLCLPKLHTKSPGSAEKNNAHYGQHLPHTEDPKKQPAGDTSHIAESRSTETLGNLLPFSDANGGYCISSDCDGSAVRQDVAPTLEPKLRIRNVSGTPTADKGSPQTRPLHTRFALHRFTYDSDLSPQEADE
ncbi:MAG: hypothetical protein M1814_001988 [Vezdaea aestivalis]|nr:MAG: hypothetical protein M1814_001988 [Vezdaea aestivalis]